MRKGLGFALVGMMVIGTVTMASTIGAQADPAGQCNMGTFHDSGVSFAVDGVPIVGSGNGVYGDYVLDICRDSANYTYSVSVNAFNPTFGTQDKLTAAELEHSFTVGFTPQAGDIPVIAEGHGDIASFSIDSANSNSVTFTAKPLAYSDIYGSDCGNQPPAQCVISAGKASVDAPAELRVGVRFGDSQGRGMADFGMLPGMHWSSSAYYFYQRASCPTMTGQAGTSNSFSGLQVELGGPHFKADGVTINTGSVKVFIPTVAVVSCFGGPPSMVLPSLKLTRTEGSTTTAVTKTGDEAAGLYYEASADDATGLTITIPTVTFSKPKYKVGTKTGRSLARSTKSFTSLGSLVRVAKPARGKLKVSVSTKKVCAAGVSSVYGFKQGTCSFTVTSYSKTGKKVKTARGSFRIR